MSVRRKHDSFNPFFPVNGGQNNLRVKSLFRGTPNGVRKFKNLDWQGLHSRELGGCRSTPDWGLCMEVYPAQSNPSVGGGKGGGVTEDSRPGFVHGSLSYSVQPICAGGGGGRNTGRKLAFFLGETSYNCFHITPPEMFSFTFQFSHKHPFIHLICKYAGFNLENSHKGKSYL